MMENATSSVWDASFSICNFLSTVNLMNRITGKNPFYTKDQKAIFSKNKKCELNFDDPKVATFSPAGNS